MKRIEYRTIDKSGWGDGPWQNEPDKIQWRDDATGLPCLMVRVPHHGAWCGYVGVSKDNSAHGIEYDTVYQLIPELEVHGGLTFASKCAHGDESKSICHVVEAGEDDDVWWLGFDCVHAGDFAPAMDARSRAYGLDSDRGAIYRDQAYVNAEVQRLATQLATIQ